MEKPEIPLNEEKRLEELLRLNIIGSGKEEAFQDMVELASTICGVPISLITLIDTDKQWFKAKKGLDVDSTDREVSFCGHAIHDDELFIVENTVADKRFYDNPLVTADPNIRFYAGMPLKTVNGYNLGTLCVLDSKPKKLSENQKKALILLGKQVSKLIELHDKKNELTIKNEKLEELNQFNKRITEIISHDIKGPISSLKSYLNLSIFKNASPEELKNLFPIVRSNVEGINDLVENLIEWSRSSKEVDISPSNLQDSILELFKLFSTSAQHKNIELTHTIDDDLKVMADISMLRFILRNLLNNAIKFTESGRILIQADIHHGNQVKIKVIDDGIGIKPELLNRIKDKSKRVSTLGTRKEKGSGLGLQLIDEFLKIHDSVLEIKSEENKGSIFSFILPLAT